MSTLIQIAQGIESDYQGDTVGSVKVCRPQMGQPISAGNAPFFRETGSVQEMQESGLYQGYLIVKAQINSAGDMATLNVGCVGDVDSSSYSISVDGRTALDNYKKHYRPFNTENDNLWALVLDYFATTRGLRFIEKLEIQVGTPVYGKVNGLNFVGDGGAEDHSALNEFWAFEATYPWATPGNIRSWKF